MLSPKKTNLYHLTHHTWKISPHYLVKFRTFSSDWTHWAYIAFLQTLVAQKKASCGLALVALKRTSCDVRQMECQTSNVTANVQSDHLLHGYMLPVFFAIDQLHRPPCSTEIQAMSQQDASTTHPCCRLALDTCDKNLKNEKFVHFTR